MNTNHSLEGFNYNSHIHLADFYKSVSNKYSNKWLACLISGKQNNYNAKPFLKISED